MRSADSGGGSGAVSRLSSMSINIWSSGTHNSSISISNLSGYSVRILFKICFIRTTAPLYRPKLSIIRSGTPSAFIRLHSRTRVYFSLCIAWYSLKYSRSRPFTLYSFPALFISFSSRSSAVKYFLYCFLLGSVVAIYSLLDFFF